MNLLLRSPLTLVFIFLYQFSIGQEFNGYTLYNNLNSRTTYLIDKNEDIAHTWSLEERCNYAVLLMPTGNIMRGTFNQGNQINGAAVGGAVQEIDPQGNVVWEFVYSGPDHVSHHDISLMPDGNVLLIAWERKTGTTLTDAGYMGTFTTRYPTHFVEVSQIGDTNEGEIVWEWHIWDHMIQDVDPNKPNYGVVADNPQLMDINVPSSGGGGPMGGGGDWFHVNGVDYNEELDIIAFSSRFVSEVFIIDHSTTMEEAASHEGGNFGMGGDLLYRYGKPTNYDTPGTNLIPAAVHDARFITNDGRERAGYLQMFNNGVNGQQSLVDAIRLPYNADSTGFIRQAGEAFQPNQAPTFRHHCLSNASGQSASNSMSNGNIFVNLSGGYMYEVDSENNPIWQYNAGPAKAFRYECDHPGIQKLIADEVIEDLCSPASNNTDFLQTQISIFPNPSSGTFKIQNLEQDQIVSEIVIFDAAGKKVNGKFLKDEIDLSGQEAGLYFATIHFVNGFSTTKKLTLTK